VKNFLGSFWAWTASLAGIAALYVGAVAIHKTLIFWIVIGCGVVLAGARPAFKSVVDLAIRVRNYPKIIKQLGEAKSDTQTAMEHLRNAESRADTARKDGISEGRNQILGAIRALEIEVLPEIVGILDDAGTIAIAGKYSLNSMPPLNARFHVVSTSSGEVKGTVQVTRRDDESRIACLRCVEPTVQAFWKHLAERVEYDGSPPRSVQLERYPLPEGDSIVNGGSEQVDVAIYVGGNDE
jgi:hypothetical protein